MAINVALDVFSGPLDLLLQLVRRSEISVWDIRIKSICDQFIAYTEQLQSIDVELAGDFLVMASTLVRIKARLLLPQPPTADEFAEEEMDEEEALLTRLLLYEGYREAAAELEALAQSSAAYYPRGARDAIERAVVGDPLEGITLMVLALLAKGPEKEPLPEALRMRLTPEAYTVPLQMAHVESLLAGSGTPLSFLELLSFRATREEIVTTFLAILELVRLQRIVVRQDGHRAPILVTGRDV